MATFSYKGYDFEVDHTPNEEEFAQMASHVDTLPPKAPKTGAPEGTYGGALKSAFAGVGNLADVAGSTLYGGGAALLGADQTAIDTEEAMRERIKQRNEWANPEGAEFTTGQKLAGALATLPMQVIGAGLSPATTVDTMLQSGESTGQALKAGAVDAAGNLIGIAVPGWKQGSMAVRGLTGAAAGAGQDYATKKAIQALAETEKGKKAFEPSASDAAVAGLIGGGMGAAMGSKGVKPSANPTVKALQEAQAARTAAKEMAPVEAPAPDVMGRVAEQLGYQEGAVSPLRNKPAMTDMAEQLARSGEQQRGIIADTEIAARQQQMETEMRQRLAQEATIAERARQENAPVGSPEYQARLAALAEQQRLAEVQTQDPALRAQEAEATRVAQEQKGKTSLPETPIYELAPNGQLRVKQETPVATEMPTKTNLETAVEKIASGQKFSMNSEERVMWTKTRAALDSAVDGFKTLSDKQIMSKIQDRAWVQSAVDKVKQMQSMYSDIATRSKNLKTNQEALKKRELLNDHLETLDQLLQARPDTSSKLQGPKTMEAKRAEMSFNTRTRRQGGGLFLGESTKLENSLTEQPDVQIPKNPETEAVVAKALKEGKDGKLWTYMQSGATSAAMKTGSAAIKAASEIIQNGIKRGEQSIRTYVFPAEQSLRLLSKNELTTLKDVFMEEGKSGQRFDADLLESTLSIKQLEAYVNMRNMFDDTLAAQNAARVAKGQEPITANEAYMASRWEGDFRRPVYDYTLDKNGNKQFDAEGNPKTHLVWYLASNSKLGLEYQSKHLLKEFPDLVIDAKKDHTVRSTTGKTDLQSMYTTMLDLLGRDDPAIAKIKQAIEDQTSAEAQTTLSQEKHFENKAGIRGYVGERPGHSGTREALAMFQQQVQYAKNAYKWSEMQKAADDIKGIVSDKGLQEQQPNNVKYIREYFKNAIGHGEAETMRSLEDSFRNGLGVSPKVVNEAIGDLKGVFILQKLGVSAGYSMANFIQASNTIPYLMDLRAKGFKGNPVTALAVGVPGGLAMTASHYLKSLGGEYVSLLPNQFFKDAFQYAENNGVTSRSIYDEGPLSGSFGGISRVGELMGKTMTAPEVMVRSVAFMSYAQMLKDSGKFTDQNKMFQKAEEYVNMSMVDYRETERPLIFSKMGGAGNFLNTLQTYPMSFYNQYAYMAHEAFSNKNPTPLVVSLALQGAIAGAMGVPYTEDAYKLFMFIKDNMVSTGTWAKMKDSPLLSDPKLWMMETLGKGSVYGALSENTGLGLTSRVAAPGVGAMLQSPVGPAVDIAGQIGALGSAVMEPTNAQKWAQVGIKSIPTGLQGLFETAPFMKDHTFVERPDGKKVFMKTSDLAAREAKYARTPEEVAMRKWGLRSQKEVVESDVTYATEHANQVLKERSGKLVGEYYDAVRSGNREKAAARMKLYTELTGKEISDVQAEQELRKEFLTKSERVLTKEGSPAELVNSARMQKLIDMEFGK